MYIYAHECTYMHMYVHTCAWMYIYAHEFRYMHMNVHICTWMYIYAHVCTHMHMYVHTCTCMYIHICTCIYIYAHVCTYMHMYVCTYMHMYVCTYMHMYVHVYTSNYIHDLRIKNPFLNLLTTFDVDPFSFGDSGMRCRRIGNQDPPRRQPNEAGATLNVEDPLPALKWRKGNIYNYNVFGSITYHLECVWYHYISFRMCLVSLLIIHNVFGSITYHL
jgi:hypothetical protein